MNSQKIVFLVGAGMSTSAGIPDFRSVGGVQETFGTDLFHRLTVENDPQRMHDFVTSFFSKNYVPTKAHRILRILQDRGVLLRVLTQNIDGLEEKAGIDKQLILNVHGSLQNFRCLNNFCTGRLTNEEYLKYSTQSYATPRCYKCNGANVMRPDILLYGEEMNQDIEMAARLDMYHCDLFICVGTSLRVNPVAGWPLEHLSLSNAVRIWINREPPPPDYVNFFDIIMCDNCDDAMSTLFDVRDEPIPENKII